MSTSTPGRNNGHDSIVNELDDVYRELINLCKRTDGPAKTSLADAAAAVEDARAAAGRGYLADGDPASAIAWEIAAGVRTPGARELVLGLRVECVAPDTWTIATVDGDPVDRVTITEDTTAADVLEHLEALAEEVDTE